MPTVGVVVLVARSNPIISASSLVEHTLFNEQAHLSCTCHIVYGHCDKLILKLALIKIALEVHFGEHLEHFRSRGVCFYCRL